MIAAAGEESSFAILAAQPSWRAASFGARFRRFVGARSGRKSYYAAAIVRALEPDSIPAPLSGLVDHVRA